MIKVRPATLKDCKACYNLSNVPELLTPYHEAPPIYWFQNIVKERQILLVAEDNKIIVGYIMGERISGNWTALHLLSVAPDYRGKGIGRKLIVEFEKECKRRNLSGIMTYIHDNPHTTNFFKRNKYSLGSKVIEGIKPL